MKKLFTFIPPNWITILIIILQSSFYVFAQDVNKSEIKTNSPRLVTDQCIVVVTLKDGLGVQLAAGGDVVSLSSSNGLVNFSPATDNSDGTYTFIATTSQPGDIIVSATVNGNAIKSDAVIRFLPIPGGVQSDVIITKDKVWAIHTNFILPLFRFDRTVEDQRNPRFRTSVFSSLGAGINLARGTLTTTQELNSQNEPVNSTFTNYFGAQFGVIFSSVSNEGENENFIGLLMGLTFLDMQVSWGYNFGTRPEGLEGHFFTLAYGIPIQRLTNKGSLVFRDKKKAKPSKKTIPPAVF